MTLLSRTSSPLSSSSHLQNLSSHHATPSHLCTNPHTRKPYLFFCSLGLHPRHMEVSRLGVYLELQLPAYATGTATPDLSCICDLHHSSRQRQILNLLSEVRDRTRNLMVPSRILFRCAATGTPRNPTLNMFLLPSHPTAPFTLDPLPSPPTPPPNAQAL